MAETWTEKQIREAEERDPAGMARARARFKREQERYNRVALSLSVSSGRNRRGLRKSLRGYRADQLMENLQELIVEHFRRHRDTARYAVSVKIVQKGA
jgi:hypothetical protein